MSGFHRHTDTAMETMPLHGLQKRDMDRIGNQSYTMHLDEVDNGARTRTKAGASSKGT